MRNPPMLNSRIILALLLTAPGLALLAQEPNPAHTQAPKSPQQSEESKTAVELVAKALKTLKGYSSVTAKVRETVVMGTRRFTAEGTYVQSTDNQLRLELEVGDFEQLAKKRVAPQKQEEPSGAAPAKTQTEGEAEKENTKRNAVLHVCDGRFLWTQWTTNGKSRIDLRNIQEIGKELGGEKSENLEQLMGRLGVGGVPMLMAALQSRMVFNSTAEKTIDGVDYFVVQGRWTDQQFQAMLAQGRPTPQEMQAMMAGQKPLPGYLPEYVRLFFEKETMFPRRIMFLKQPQRNVMQARPMVTMDFTDVVLNGDVDSESFRFKPPAGKTPDDQTQQIIKALRAQQAQQNQQLGPVRGAAGQ